MTTRILALGVLVLAGCSGAKTDAPPPPAEAAVINNAPASIAEATFAPSLGIDLSKFEHNDAGLYWRDVVVGEGPVVTAGQIVTVHYTGNLPDGTEFETSRGGDPIKFPIGVGRVITGWEMGVVGMRVGSTRQLLIPGDLAYGPSGSGPIPPNAALIFSVEVMAAD